MKTMKIKKTAGERFFDGFNVAFLFLFTLLMLYPIIYVFAISLSSAQAVDQGGFFLWPRDFSLDAYKVVFSEPNMGRSYLNTVFYAFTNTFLGMAFTSMLAYALSVQDYVLKKPITVMLTITMFISGGLIPGYLLNKALHLIDTVWVMIIPGISAAVHRHLRHAGAVLSGGQLERLVRRDDLSAPRGAVPVSAAAAPHTGQHHHDAAARQSGRRRISAAGHAEQPL